MTSRALLMSILVLVSASSSYGEDIFKVRIHNDTGSAIRLKAVGYNNQAFFIDDLDVGANVRIDQFLGGDRAFIAFDDINENVIAIGHKNVNSNMHIHIKTTGVTYQEVSGSDL